MLLLSVHFHLPLKECFDFLMPKTKMILLWTTDLDPDADSDMGVKGSQSVL